MLEGIGWGLIGGGLLFWLFIAILLLGSWQRGKALRDDLVNRGGS